jgi:mannitol/fructose-specific phosphotransferase system IIA component (Ntr-type)
LFLKDLMDTAAAVVVTERLGRDDLLRELVRALVAAEPSRGLDEAVILAGLMQRESLSSTAFGLGVAVPHCFLPGVGRPVMVVGCSRIGVDFGSMDGEPVHAAFVLVEDLTARGAHTAIVSRIARLCRDTQLVRRLRAASAPAEAAAALAEEDARAG